MLLKNATVIWMTAAAAPAPRGRAGILIDAQRGRVDAIMREGRLDPAAVDALGGFAPNAVHPAALAPSPP
jgi:hypothetical protein